VASGTPEEVAKVARSYTGQYLKPLLKGRAIEKVAPARKLKAAE
jgi:excinuclease ABC subunit A